MEGLRPIVITRTFCLVLVFHLLQANALESRAHDDGAEAVNPDRMAAGGIDESTFHAILDKIEDIYTPEVARYGKKLVVSRLWKSRRVEAQAVQAGQVWQITFHGGLARHAAMTDDGFAHVACHELGHHLGGAPRFGMGLSSEGQADYFATLKCLRRIFAKTTSSQPRTDLPTLISESCARSFPSAAEARICERSAMASLDVGVFNATFWPSRNPQIPKFESPDPAQVAYTLPGYPSVQCRLDTSFQGALCPKPMDEPLSFIDPTVGTCSSERGDQVGTRPRCWYRPMSAN